MNLLFFPLFLIVSHLNLLNNDSLCFNSYNYFSSTAELKITQDSFGKALNLYKEAFTLVRKPLKRDLYNAAVCSAILKDTDFCYFTTKQLLLKGLRCKDFQRNKIFKVFRKSLKWKLLLIQEDSFRSIYERGLNKVVIKEIADMDRRDQEVRWHYPRLRKIQKDTLRIIDSINCNKFLKICSLSGFPSEELIGYQNIELYKISLHHFSYYKELFPLIFHVLCDAYNNHLIPSSLITYLVDMNARVQSKTIVYGNIAYYAYRRKEYSPLFAENPKILECINGKRKAMGCLSFQEYQKIAKFQSFPSAIRTILATLFHKQKFEFNREWYYEFVIGRNPIYKQTIAMEKYFEFNKCN